MFWYFFYRLNRPGSRAGVAGHVEPVVYAQHGHELMGCKSPVGEPKSMIVSIPKWIDTTSRRQGQTREGMSEGSPSATQRAYEQKRHTRPSRRGELAQDNETHGFARQGKSGGCVVTDICSCNICIPAIPGGCSSCFYLGRSVQRAVYARRESDGGPGRKPWRTHRTLMRQHSAWCGNARRDCTEVSRRPSSQTPIVMVGTR